MRNWLLGLVLTLALVCCLAAVWEPHHRHWWQWMVTVGLLCTVALGIMEGDDDGKED